VCYLSNGGWFYGLAAGFGSRNLDLRRAQFRKADDGAFCLALSHRFVTAKIRNQRTVLRRNGSPPDAVLRQMEELAVAAGRTGSRDELMGVEGAAARAYFSCFATMLKPKGEPGPWTFRFEGRNRRPPLDPVNALLSLCYSLLAKDCGLVCLAVGFDPLLGFLHTAHHGRQSLALDLMEEFRPILADSTVLSVINNGEVKATDFVRAARAVSLKPAARKTVIAAYERRLDQVLTHPTFGYKVSYRKVLEVQARLLSRYVLGELAEFPAILPR
jgi:CRISPR-associated protein Cas1